MPLLKLPTNLYNVLKAGYRDAPPNGTVVTCQQIARLRRVADRANQLPMPKPDVLELLDMIGSQKDRTPPPAAANFTPGQNVTMAPASRVRYPDIPTTGTVFAVLADCLAVTPGDDAPQPFPFAAWR